MWLSTYSQFTLNVLIALAQTQQAKATELRATLSLSRFHLRQGQSAAAYEPLAAIYHWFTEGLNTAHGGCGGTLDLLSSYSHCTFGCFLHSFVLNSKGRRPDGTGIAVAWITSWRCNNPRRLNP